MTTLQPSSPATSLASPLATLVVPTYRRTVELEPMLRSMAAQTEQRFEIIVVDQNGDDRLVPILAAGRASGLSIEHVRLTQPGLSAARNAGLARARADIIAFPDDDCWYEPDVVAKALSHFNDNAEAKGVIGHWVDLGSRDRRPNDTLSPDDWRAFRGGDVACFRLFFRTACLRAYGGYNEEFGLGRYFGAGEEEELIYRMVMGGVRLDYVSSIRIHHPHIDVPTLEKGLCRRCRSYGRGTGAVLAKHGLPAWVIARGVLGPIYRAVRGPRPGVALVLSSFTLVGRLEGMFGWWWRSRRAA